MQGGLGVQLQLRGGARGGTPRLRQACRQPLPPAGADPFPRNGGPCPAVGESGPVPWEE